MSISLKYRDINQRYIRDPRLGHRLGRNYPENSHEDPIWNIRWLGTNQNGFYGQKNYVNLTKQSDTVRVILLGGSAAMGLGASSKETTIQAFLQKKFDVSFPNKKVEVLNCAVGDYSSAQALAAFSLELIEYDPDVVVLFDGFNDFSHSCWGSKFSKGKWLPNTTRSFDDNLFAVLAWDGTLIRRDVIIDKWRRSNLGSKIQYYKKRFDKKSRILTHGTHGMIWDDPTLWSVKKEAIYWHLNNIQSIAGICSIRDIKFLHCLQPCILWGHGKKLTDFESARLELFNTRMPNLHELAQSYFNLFIHEYNSVMTKLEKDTGSKKFRYFDGSSLFQEDIDTLFVDPIHFNDQGQLVIAEQLFEFLLEMEIFQ